MGWGGGCARAAARAAGTPPGHGVILCSQPCPVWLEAAWTGGGGSHCPPQCPTHPVVSGNRRRVTKPGCPWLPSAAWGWGTGQCQLRAEAAPWMWQHGPGDLCPTLGVCPVSLLCPCHSCPRASQRCCWGSPRAQPGQRCPSASTGLLPPGMFARWHGHRMGDGEGSDRAALGHRWVFPYPDSGPQSVPAAPGRGDVGLCQRVGEAELRQEC